jgi:hypothetical protein
MQYRIIEHSNNQEQYFTIQYRSREKSWLYGELWDDLPSQSSRAFFSQEIEKFTALFDAQQYIRSQDWKWRVVEEVTT